MLIVAAILLPVLAGAVLPLLKCENGKQRALYVSAVTLSASLLTVLAMQAGRAARAILLGTPVGTALGFITTDAVTYIFTSVILWIMSRLDGMMEDQEHYLARVNNPEDREGGIA